MRNAIMAAMVLTMATLAQAGGHWRFERTYVDGADTKTPDASGNGNHGTLVNGPSLTAGRVGRGMNLDGTNQYVTTPVGFSIGLHGAAGITISAWVNPANTTGTVRIFNGTISDGSVGYELRLVSGVPQVRARSTPGDSLQSVNASATIGTGWSHVVAVINYATDTVTIYVNRVAVVSSGVTFAQDTLNSEHNTTRSGIGATYLGIEAFPGTIDEPIITPFAWTAEEVRAYYHSGEIPSRRAE